MLTAITSKFKGTHSNQQYVQVNSVRLLSETDVATDHECVVNFKVDDMGFDEPVSVIFSHVRDFYRYQEWINYLWRSMDKFLNHIDRQIQDLANVTCIIYQDYQHSHDFKDVYCGVFSSIDMAQNKVKYFLLVVEVSTLNQDDKSDEECYHFLCQHNNDVAIIDGLEIMSSHVVVHEKPNHPQLVMLSYMMTNTPQATALPNLSMMAEITTTSHIDVCDITDNALKKAVVATINRYIAK